MNNNVKMKKPWKVWKDIPGYKFHGRYFGSAKDYKEAMIIRQKERHILSVHINRNLSDREKKSFIPFVEEHLCYKENNYCTSPDLYPIYKKFCEEKGYTPLIPTTFAICIKVYVFLQENIPGVLYSEKDVILREKSVGYYNLGLKD